MTCHAQSTGAPQSHPRASPTPFAALIGGRRVSWLRALSLVPVCNVPSSFLIGGDFKNCCAIRRGAGRSSRDVCDKRASALAEGRKRHYTFARLFRTESRP